jgi:hypothetical protein
MGNENVCGFLVSKKRLQDQVLFSSDLPTLEKKSLGSFVFRSIMTTIGYREPPAQIEDKEDLWYTKDQFDKFRKEANAEIKKHAKKERISCKQSIKELYQP